MLKDWKKFYGVEDIDFGPSRTERVMAMQVKGKPRFGFPLKRVRVF